MMNGFILLIVGLILAFSVGYRQKTQDLKDAKIKEDIRLLRKQILKIENENKK